MLLVARRNVSYHEAAVHGRDDEPDSELWCTGNLCVFTWMQKHPACSKVQDVESS
jgi:hypothetical protein